MKLNQTLPQRTARGILCAVFAAALLCICMPLYAAPAQAQQSEALPASAAIYEANFIDHDGTALPEFSWVQLQSGDDVTMPSWDNSYRTEQANFVFDGWTLDGSYYRPGDTYTMTANNVTFAAHYTANPILYSVSFYDYDGTLIQSTEQMIGEGVSAPQTSRPSNISYSYNFLGWLSTSGAVYSDAVPPVSGSEAYTACFESVAIPVAAPATPAAPDVSSAAPDDDAEQPVDDGGTVPTVTSVTAPVSSPAESATTSAQENASDAAAATPSAEADVAEAAAADTPELDEEIIESDAVPLSARPAQDSNGFSPIVVCTALATLVVGGIAFLIYFNRRKREQN